MYDICDCICHCHDIILSLTCPSFVLILLQRGKLYTEIFRLLIFPSMTKCVVYFYMCAVEIIVLHSHIYAYIYMHICIYLHICEPKSIDIGVSYIITARSHPVHAIFFMKMYTGIWFYGMNAAKTVNVSVYIGQH